MGNEQSIPSPCSTGCFSRGPTDPFQDGVAREPAQVLGPHHKSLLRGLPKPRISKLDDRTDGPPVTVQIISDLHLEFLQTVFELPSFDGNRSAGSLGELSHSWQFRSSRSHTGGSSSSQQPSSSSSSDDDTALGSLLTMPNDQQQSSRFVNSFSFLFAPESQQSTAANQQQISEATSEATSRNQHASRRRRQRPQRRRQTDPVNGDDMAAISDLKLHFSVAAPESQNADNEAAEPLDLSFDSDSSGNAVDSSIDASMNLDYSAIIAATTSDGNNISAIDPQANTTDPNDHSEGSYDDDDDNDDDDDDDELSDEKVSSEAVLIDQTTIDSSSASSSLSTSTSTGRGSPPTNNQSSYLSNLNQTQNTGVMDDDDDDDDELSSTLSLQHHDHLGQHDQLGRGRSQHQSIIESTIPHFNFQAAESTFRQFVQTTPVRSSFLALLGDIGNPEFEAYGYFLRWCASQYDRVFVVAGDHEGFGLDRPWSVTLKMISNACADAGENVIFCYKTAIEMDNFRILATTLWTDVQGRTKDGTTESTSNLTNKHKKRDKEQEKPVDEVEKLMGALSIGVIDAETGEGRKATAHDTGQWHQEEVEWLRKELQENPTTPTLVLTHHAPLMCCLEPEMLPTDAQAPFYCSQLSDLFTEPVVAWAYGHTHFPLDCRVGPVRLVSNPAGFPHQEFPKPGGRSFRANFVLEF